MEAPSRAFSLLLRILSGPLAFILIWLAPLEGLEPQAHTALGCYAWVVAWWAARPIPWAITGFLPLVLFPLASVMPFRDTIGLYGQRVFPFLLGIMLFGHAFRKHGLAKRIAVTVLSIPGVATSGTRLIMMILIVTAVLSALVDDAAAVAIMIPIALSLARFAGDMQVGAPGAHAAPTPKFLAASCLAVLYGSAAGGMATPAGVPFNPLAISLLDQLTTYQISFAQWTLTGTILTIALLPIYYIVLRVMSPREVQGIAGATAYFGDRKKELDALGRGEWNVLLVLVVMVVLWFLPGFATVPVLDIWFVPPVAMVLLFLLPVNARKGEMTLNAGDFQEGVLWNVLFLVVSGTALASGLAQLGIPQWLGAAIQGGVSSSALPWIAGLATPVLSHLTSGTATTSMVSTVLFPIAEGLDYNPAILARIIAGTALAVSFPWSGAAAGTAFSSGSISFGTMFKTGAVATVLTAIAITVLSIVLVPALGAFGS